MGLYREGDMVKTRIIFGAGAEENIWIAACIRSFNEEDNTYNLDVRDPKLYNVREQAVHVPEEFIQAIFSEDDILCVKGAGYSTEEATEALEKAYGDLEDALLILHKKDRLANQSCSSLDGLTAPSSNQSSRTSSSISKRSSTSQDTDLMTGHSASPSTSSYRKTSFCDDVNQRGKITVNPREDEFDYCVQFDSTPLGFEVHPCQDNRNGCVGKRLNDYSKKNVHKGSLILACNDIWLLGQDTVYIQQCIIAETQHPPVTITFRAKKWMKTKRSRNLRKSIERSRSLRSLSSSSQRSSQSENFLSPRRISSFGVVPVTKVVNTKRRRSSTREEKQIANVIENPELRCLVMAAKTNFGASHIVLEMNGETKETKHYTSSRNPVFGETLTWQGFQMMESNVMTVSAMSGDIVVGSGIAKVPILPGILNAKVDLIGPNKNSGHIDLKVTHVR